MTIRTKLTLSIAVLFSIALGTLGWLLVDLQRRELIAESMSQEKVILASVRRAAQDALVQKDDLILLSYIKFLEEQYPVLSYVRVNWIRNGRTRTHMIGEKHSSARPEIVKEIDPTDPNWQVVMEAGLNRYLIQERIDREIGKLQRDLFRLFGIALIIAILFSDWFARKITRPLSALSQVAGEIAKGRLGARLEWNSNDEIGALVKGFNRMSGRLEELDHMKKDFVSAVTHELRSPLGAIESFLNLMERRMVGGVPSDPKQFKEYFGRIKANVSRLGGFINDLLDVAKIERGKMECVLKPMRVQDVASDVVQFFEAKSKEGGVQLINSLDPSLGAVEGDSDRLRQVFVNLVSNALKFTPEGGKVTIGAEQFREDGRKFLEIQVTDTGKGMDLADQKRLFQKFAQGKNVESGVRGPHGTGLGLFIVRSIVEAHGGKVGVQSTPGRGSRFKFMLRMVN
jgi:signal transduction histidine kinase